MDWEKKNYICERWKVKFKCNDNCHKINYQIWIFRLNESFHGTCFGHVFLKTCQYVINNEKVSKNLQFISIKSTQSNLQKCITWLKNSGKGRQGQNKTCLNFNIHPRKLNIPIKTRWFFKFCTNCFF